MARNTKSAERFVVRHYQAKFWGALTGRMPNGAFADRKNRIIMIAHRRWGKDELALRATNVMLHREIGSYWHCLPQFEQARKVVWDQVNKHTGMRRIDECFPEHTRASTNDTRMMIKFKNGSTWQLIGSDSYDKNVGAGAAGIVFSEWALANPAAWAFFRPMLVESKGWAVFITTPRGNNHAKRMFDSAMRKQAAEKALHEGRLLDKQEMEDLIANDWYAEHSTIYDTMALTEAEAEDALDDYVDSFGPDMGTLLFEQEYECAFNGIQIGSYWGRYIAEAEKEGRVRPFNVDFRKPIHTAWDLGKSENNPIWVFQVVGGEPRIIDFYKPMDSSDINDWCRWLDERGYTTGRDYVPHDAMNVEWGGSRTRIDMLREAGRRPVLVPRAALADGNAAGVRTIQNAVFRDTLRVRQGIDGLRAYRREWDEERDCYKDAPFKDWAEHIASAFRYLSLSWRDMPEAKRNRENELPKEEVFTADAHGRVQSNLTLEERCFLKCGMKPPKRGAGFDTARKPEYQVGAG